MTQKNRTSARFRIDHIPCEVYEGRWPGPTKRGRSILQENVLSASLHSPADVVNLLKSKYLQHFSHIESLVFYPQATRSEIDPKAWLPFVVCYTKPRFLVRQKLFEAAAELAQETGWYLLVTGRYLHRQGQLVPNAFEKSRALCTPIIQKTWGDLKTVRSLSTGDGGTCLQIEMQNLTIQLDCGFYDTGHNSDFVFVSHAHSDHTGGLDETLKRSQRVLMNEATFQLLNGRSRWSGSESLGVVRPGFVLESQDGGKIEWFAGYHSNDAVMLRLTDRSGHQLLYTGDLCLKNGFYQESPAQLLSLFDSNAPQSLLLADGCFWGRSLTQEGMRLDELKQNLESLLEQHQPIVFVASSVDYLYPLYLWFFRNFNSGANNYRVPTTISENLYQMLYSGYRGYNLDKRHHQDIFIRQLMHNSFIAYLGSAQVYAPSELQFIAAHGKSCVSFVHSLDLKLIPSQTTCFVLGNPNRTETKFLMSQCQRFKKVHPLFGEEFSFHSGDTDAHHLFHLAASRGIDVALFHASKDQMRKAIRKLPVEAGQVAHLDDFDWSWGFE